MTTDQVSAKQVERFLEHLNAHDRSIFACILAQVPNLSDAEQIAQETRTKLWQQFDRYQLGSDFGAWARTIANYLVLAHYERQSRDRLRFGESFVAAMQQQIESRVDGISPRREALSECLKRLPDRQREMLLSYYSGEQTRQWIAEQQRKSYAGLRQAVRRVRLALAECIDQRLGHASGIQ